MIIAVVEKEIEIDCGPDRVNEQLVKLRIIAFMWYSMN